MKKTWILFVLCVIGFIFVFTGCDSLTKPKKEETTTYTVTFDSDGGSAVESQEVEEGEKVVKPTNPTKTSTATEEYEFLGWYLGEELWDFENDVANQDITLKAKWKVVKYTGEYTPVE